MQEHKNFDGLIPEYAKWRPITEFKASVWNIAMQLVIQLTPILLGQFLGTLAILGLPQCGYNISGSLALGGIILLAVVAIIHSTVVTLFNREHHGEAQKEKPVNSIVSESSTKS